VDGSPSQEPQMHPSTRLSTNFILSEVTKSDTATRLGVDNTPSDEVIQKLEFTLHKGPQQVRDYYKLPTIITSGYRSLKLNRLIGSSDSSQHITGEAIDFEVPGVSNYDVAVWVRDNLDYDQLILEFFTGEPSSGWVHYSVSNENKNRFECLTINDNVKRGLRIDG